jgi:hypothetical protein
LQGPPHVDLDGVARRQLRQIDLDGVPSGQVRGVVIEPGGVGIGLGDAVIRSVVMPSARIGVLIRSRVRAVELTRGRPRVDSPAGRAGVGGVLRWAGSGLVPGRPGVGFGLVRRVDAAASRSDGSGPGTRVGGAVAREPPESGRE